MKSRLLQGSPYIFLYYNLRYRNCNHTLFYLCKCSFFKLFSQLLHQHNTILYRTRLHCRTNQSDCFLHECNHRMQIFSLIHFCMNNSTAPCQNLFQLIQNIIRRHAENWSALSIHPGPYMNYLCIHVNTKHTVRRYRIF